jgi:hypothetical protein
MEMAAMAMYVVFSLTKGQMPDVKVFARRADASAHAKRLTEDEADTADLYEVDATEARAARAALEMGEGHFLEAHGRRATPAEIADSKLQRDAAVAALRELVKQHNDLVSSGEAGVLETHPKQRVKLPRVRERLDALILKMLSKPQYADRIRRHVERMRGAQGS